MPDQFLHGIETVEISDGIRPIQTVKSSLIGFVGTAPDANATVFPVNTPILITGPRMAAELGSDGTLLDAYNAAYMQGVNLAVVVRVAEGETPAATLTNVAGTPTAGTGVYALLNSSNLNGQVPRILAAPGFTAAAGPLTAAATALLAVAPRLRAVAIIDGPNTTEAAALAARALIGSDRAYMVDPAVRVWDETTSSHVTRPASAYVAGALSASDARRGFWWSPSNQVLLGVAATARPISWAISDPDTEANRLNADEIATIVRADGFRLWGNRSCSSDPQWAFLVVRRVADMVYESAEQAHLWAMDRPFSAQLLIDMRDGVQSYIDTLISRGALLGGSCWIDPELNTEAMLKAGQLYIDFDLEPPAPLERLTLRARRNGGYYEELMLSVAAQ